MIVEPLWSTRFRNQMVNNIQSGRTPHATLLTGPEGSGLMAHALWMSSALLCTDMGASGEPCGVCSSCLKTTKLIHPDVHFTVPVISPGTGKKATSETFLEEWREYLKENTYPDYRRWIETISGDTIKKGNISRAECDRLLYLSQMKSYEGGKKVFIIWMAEFLGKEGNSLLKILEEPPKDTYFILLSHRPSHIISTILSRVQKYKFSKYSPEEIEKIIDASEQKLSQTRRKEIVDLVDGNAAETLFLVQNGEENWSENLLTLLRYSYLRNGKEASSWVNQSAKWSRDQMTMFFRYGLHFLQECSKQSAIGAEYQMKLTEPEKKAALWLNEKCGQRQLEKMVSVFSSNIHYISRNANAKILLFATVTKLIQIFHKN